jgi:hypothetical protein
VQHAADHGRGRVVRKETLAAGDAGPLMAALEEVVVNKRDAYRRQVGVVHDCLACLLSVCRAFALDAFRGLEVAGGQAAFLFLHAV